MQREATIAAIASAAGACARIVVRISGPESYRIVGAMAECDMGSGRAVRRVSLNVEGMRFPAVVLLFEQGKSYTGEQSAELHLPGNVPLARMVLGRTYELGARPAEPGEFTARAFFNGQLDLTEAEGVAAAIAATNEQELAAARRLRGGELARRLRPIVDDLTQTLALLEAGIDFSEEDIRFLSAHDLKQRAKSVADALDQLVSQSTRFERLSHEPQIVLCGRPNAGKSTLLNAMAGRQRAVVSDVAGTTRDLLSAEVMLMRGLVRVVDSAGLEGNSECGILNSESAEKQISRQMREKATEAITLADVVVLVREMGDAREIPRLPRHPDLVVASKCEFQNSDSAIQNALPVSAVTGQGMDDLRRRLDDLAFGRSGGEALALNVRHVRQIEVARSELASLENQADVNTEELSAAHLRYALDALGEITGLVSADEVLGRIFSSFCIGK